MTNISGDIDIRKVSPKKFKLLAPINILLDDGFEIRIPKGFIYDGGSLPPFMYTTMGCPFGTVADYGYLAHDYLYAEARAGRSPVSRKYADEALKELLLYRGVWRIRAAPIFRAVRMFAGLNWNRRD